MEHNGWRPNLPRLEGLKSAADMDQADYPKSWAWVYFLLHSPPERREILTTYLAEIHDKGTRARSTPGLPRETSCPSGHSPTTWPQCTKINLRRARRRRRRSIDACVGETADQSGRPTRPRLRQTWMPSLTGSSHLCYDDQGVQRLWRPVLWYA